MRLGAGLSQYIFYALMIGMPLIGWGMLSAASHPVILFGSVDLPPILETPSDLSRVNRFLNLRVADIWACYKQWGDKGAFFLTEPKDNHGCEWRCYMHDPMDTSSRSANILKRARPFQK